MSLFPRLSPNGLSVITQDAGRFSPGWLDDARWLALRGNGPGIYSSDGSIDLPWSEPDSLTVGRDGFAANYWNAELQGIKHSSGLVVEGGFHGTLSDTGQLAYLTGRGEFQVLRDTQASEYDSGAPLEYPRACATGVAWSKYEDGLQRTWYADWRGTKQRVHASGALAEFRPVPVVTPFGLWIVTYTHTDVRGYQVGTTRGFIRPCVNGRAVDGKWNAGSGLRVVWNGPAGELFDEVIDLAGPMVDLDVPAPAPVTIPPFTFPTAVVWFFEDSERPSVTPSPAPGQWSLIVESGLNPPKPVIIGRSGDLGEDLIAEWAGRWSQVRGIYVADEASRAGLQRQARMAVASMKARGLAHRPVYSYSAGNLWTDIPEIDYLGVQLYPEPGETVAQSEARWRVALQKAAGKRVALVCGLYDRRPLVGINEAQLVACVPVYAKLAAERKAQILAFAWGRAGGASSFPSLLPDLKALAAAVKTTPEIEDDMNKPGVTITEWHEIRPNVLVARAHDRNNPDHYTTEFRIENGHLRVRMTNAEGTDISNATARKVL